MTALIVGLSGFPHGIIACGFTYLSVILSGEYMFLRCGFFKKKKTRNQQPSVQFSSVQLLSRVRLFATP